MRYTIKIICGLLLSILFFACSRKTAPPVSTMHTEGLHHKWKILQMDGVQGPVADAYIDLRSIYKSGAFAGCEYFLFTPHYGHHYKMRIKNIATSFAPCPANEQGNILLKNLQAVTAFAINKNGMKLFNEKGGVLFTAAMAEDDSKKNLYRKWWITQMINANNNQLIQDSAYIHIKENGNADAKPGCNQLSFNANADDTYNISLSEATGTKMFCKDAAANEAVFTKLLPLVKKYQVVGNILKLFDKDDVLLLEAISKL